MCRARCCRVCSVNFSSNSIIFFFSVRRDIVACAQMLCQDPNANVRAAIAQRLPIVVRSLQLVFNYLAEFTYCNVEIRPMLQT